MDPRLEERAKAPRYSFGGAAQLVGRPASTLRRWSIGNRRRYAGHARYDEPLISVDGPEGSRAPLSFLNLLELDVLSQYRDEAQLPAIRGALAFAADRMGEPRPLLSVKFKLYGGELFTEFGETEEGRRLLVNASRGGQIPLREIPEAVTRTIDYDHEVARAWWPRGREVPIFVDTGVAGGQATTTETSTRVDAIVTRNRDGFDADEIRQDTGATLKEIEAALAMAA